MVMFAPGGIASLIMMNLRVTSFGKWRQLLVPYLMLLGAAMIAVTGASAMIEMVYHLQLNQVLGPEMRFAGVPLNTKSKGSWVAAVVVLVVGVLLFELARRRFAPLWGRIQEEIETEIKRREARA
jgi:branched-chain amino acid transport system permease protein